MARRVTHFSLHRIADTELRVVADVESGVLPLVEVEEAVIREYAKQQAWPHRAVTLFVLQDLEPLSRQVRPGASLPPGGRAALEHRPVVNAYDLADLSECHVFVNRQAMQKEGYWGDLLAIRGLLAHEHAHPLSENGTTRAGRSLHVEVSVEGLRAPAAPPAAGAEQAAAEPHSATTRRDRVRALLSVLAEKLCLYAPREIFANELTIRSDFGEALLHVDREALANAVRGLGGRQQFRAQLQEQVSDGSLDRSEADALLLIGDFRGYLDLALEVAAFHRAGRHVDAHELQSALDADVFPVLAHEAPPTYNALMQQYVALGGNMTAAELVRWSEGVLSILAQPLAAKGVNLQYRLRTARA